MTAIPSTPPFSMIMDGGVPYRRRSHAILIGVLMILSGLALLTLPLTVTLATLPTLQSHVAYPVSDEDEAMMRRARAYDKGLFDHGLLAVGDASDPFTPDDGTPAYETDRSYQSQLGSGMYMARITIPRIGVDMPVGHGTGVDTLETGAGHMYGTTLPVGDTGNSVIAAHRGLGAQLLFYRVGELGAGDLIYTTAAGRTVAWQVDAIHRVDPGSREELRLIGLTPGETRLTLYTCDPPGLNTRRLIVGAHRVPYVDAVSVPGQSDPWGPWIAAGVCAALGCLACLPLMPRTLTARHRAG